MNSFVTVKSRNSKYIVQNVPVTAIMDWIFNGVDFSGLKASRSGIPELLWLPL